MEEANIRNLQLRWEAETAWSRRLNHLVSEKEIPANTPVHEERADLRGAPLAGADLEGAALEGADLSSADLRGARLSGATLWKARLARTLLDGADLRLSNLVAARLPGSSLKHARLDRADADGADLSKADLQGARLNSANFENTDFSGASLSRAELVDTYFQGASLERADLSSTDLRGAHLQKTRLYAANLSQANLERALLGRANLERAFLGGAKFGGADLRAANLRNTYMHHTHLAGAVITNARLDPGVIQAEVVAAPNRLRLENALIHLVTPHLSLQELRFLGRRLVWEPMENTNSLPDIVRWLLHLAIALGNQPLPQFSEARDVSPELIQARDLAFVMTSVKHAEPDFEQNAWDHVRKLDKQAKQDARHNWAILSVFRSVLVYFAKGLSPAKS